MAVDILLVDDHPMMRTGLRGILTTQDDFQVCAEASCLQEAIAAAKAHELQIALIDLQLKDGSGLEVVQALKRQHPNVRLLVVSMHDENLYAERTLRAGAHGYISKAESSAKLIAAIRRVLDGKHAVSEAINEKILASTTGDVEELPENRILSLSNREMQTFELIADGMTAREIAEKLGVAVNTFREKIKAKLKLQSSNRLMRAAIEWKLTGVLSN